MFACRFFNFLLLLSLATYAVPLFLFTLSLSFRLLYGLSFLLICSLLFFRFSSDSCPFSAYESTAKGMCTFPLLRESLKVAFFPNKAETTTGRNFLIASPIWYQSVTRVLVSKQKPNVILLSGGHAISIYREWNVECENSTPSLQRLVQFDAVGVLIRIIRKRRCLRFNETHCRHMLFTCDCVFLHILR